MVTENKTEKLPVILQILPSLVTGGVERGTIEIARAIVEEGWTALVASSGGNMMHELHRLNAKHICLPLHSKNPLVIFINIWKISRIIRQHGVNLVHARSRAPAWSAYFAAKKCRVPFITTFHGTYNKGIARLKIAYNAIMTRGEKVIAISRFISDHIQKNYKIDPKRIEIIHRGVDLAKFDPDRVSGERIAKLDHLWHLTGDHPVITLPARLTRWKGHLVLIDALAILGRKDIVCLLVGDNQGKKNYLKEIQERIKQHNLTDIVRIVGNCTDMPAVYMLSDIIVSASTDPEAFGRVIVEAQVMGKPVIATNNGAGHEVVFNKQMVIPPNDPDSLALAIKNLLSMTPEQREKNANLARDFIIEHFSKERMCLKTLDLYRSVLGQYPLR